MLPFRVFVVIFSLDTGCVTTRLNSKMASGCSVDSNLFHLVVYSDPVCVKEGWLFFQVEHVCNIGSDHDKK